MPDPNKTYKENLKDFLKNFNGLNQLILDKKYDIPNENTKEAFIKMFRAINQYNYYPSDGAVTLSKDAVDAFDAVKRWADFVAGGTIQIDNPEAKELIKGISEVLKDNAFVSDLKQSILSTEEFVKGYIKQEDGTVPEETLTQEAFNRIGLNGKKPSLEMLRNMPSDMNSAEDVFSALLWISNNKIIAGRLNNPIDPEDNIYIKEYNRILDDMGNKCGEDFRMKFCIAKQRYSSALSKQVKERYDSYMNEDPGEYTQDVYAHIKICQDPVYIARANLNIASGEIMMSNNFIDNVPILINQKIDGVNKVLDVSEDKFINELVDPGIIKRYFKNNKMPGLADQIENNYYKLNADKIIYDSGFASDTYLFKLQNIDVSKLKQSKNDFAIGLCGNLEYLKKKKDSGELTANDSQFVKDIIDYSKEYALSLNKPEDAGLLKTVNDLGDAAQKLYDFHCSALDKEKKLQSLQGQTKLNLSDPYIGDLYLKLLNNVEIIKKCDPDFEITQQEIDAMLSPERIALHKKALEYPSTETLRNNARNKAQQFVLPNPIPQEFSRSYFYILNPNNDPEKEKQLAEILKNIGRDDEAGLEARTQFVELALNSINLLGIDEKKHFTEQDLFEISKKHSFDAALT